MIELLNEFKPALIFLGKFLLLYIVGNLLYGLYIESFEKEPDTITHLVTAQTSWMLNTAGHDTSFENVPAAPKVAIKRSGDAILNVFEGCNGINVMIVFVAFLFAFGGSFKTLIWFIPVGLLLIHFFNLLRIGFLFHLASNESPQFYYYHKYVFTATLYLVVFCLWAIWVIRLYEKPKTRTAG